MERRFFVEPKSFEFSMMEGASMLRVEEMRKGFSSVVYLGPLCTTRLASTMELLWCLGVEDFIKSFREGSKVFIVGRGGNKDNWFLKVTVYIVNGWRWILLLPKGHEGWGRSRFAVELSKVKVFFFKVMIGSPAVVLQPSSGTALVGKKIVLGLDPATKGGKGSFMEDGALSYAEVVRLVAKGTNWAKTTMSLVYHCARTFMMPTRSPLLEAMNLALLVLQTCRVCSKERH